MKRLAAILLGPNADPHRAGQVDAAMNQARAISAIAILAAVPLFLPAHGLWPLGVVALWLGWNAVASSRSRRGDYPELWLLSLTCFTQTLFAAAAVASGGPTSPVLAWMVLPLVTAPARYSDRGVAIAAGYGLICLLVPSLALGLDAFLAAPQLPAVVASSAVGSLAYARAMRSTENRQRKAATIDTLTGIGNRAALRQSFARLSERCRERVAPVGLLILDLDHFKAVNDRYGHDVGDAVLVGVSDAMVRALSGEDQVFRLGGEEFVVLLGGADAAHVAAVAECLRRTVEAAQPGGLPVTVSVGGASDPAAPAEFGMAIDLFRAADAALYEAKRAGRNRAVVRDAPPAAPSPPTEFRQAA